MAELSFLQFLIENLGAFAALVFIITLIPFAGMIMLYKILMREKNDNSVLNRIADLQLLVAELTGVTRTLVTTSTGRSTNMGNNTGRGSDNEL